MHGSFTIPMSEYYAKSSDLHTRVEQTKDSVENAFQKKVSRSIGEVDSRDLDYLENTSPYRKVKEFIEKIEEHEEKIARMANEGNVNNPMTSLVELDQHYADRFRRLREGELTAEIENSINNYQKDIEITKIENMILNMSTCLNSDEVVMIRNLLKLNPDKAINTLFSDEKFLKVLQNSDDLEKSFFKYLNIIEKSTYIPQYVVDGIFNNKKFLDIASNLSIKTQDNLVNTLIAIQEKSTLVINKSGKLADWLSTLTSLKPINYVGKGISTILNSTVGKTVTSPWFSVGTTGVISAGKSYFDKEDVAHNDIGKAVVGGTIDAIASVGYIDGILIGSRAGPWGIVGGVTLATFNYVYPNWSKGAKEGAYKLIDKSKEIGNSVKSKFSQIIGSVNDTFNKGVSKISENTNKNINYVKDKTEKLSSKITNSIEGVTGKRQVLFSP